MALPSVDYAPRDPSADVLHRVVCEHLQTFLAETAYLRGVVACAGVPLSAVTGQPIGAFCAIEGKPREWNAIDMAALRAFAQLIDAQAALSLPGCSDLSGERASVTCAPSHARPH